MATRIMRAAVLLALTVTLAGCVVYPVGGYGHHHGYYGRPGGYGWGGHHGWR